MLEIQHPSADARTWHVGCRRPFKGGLNDKGGSEHRRRGCIVDMSAIAAGAALDRRGHAGFEGIGFEFAVVRPQAL